MRPRTLICWHNTILRLNHGRIKSTAKFNSKDGPVDRRSKVAAYNIVDGLPQYRLSSHSTDCSLCTGTRWGVQVSQAAVLWAAGALTITSLSP